MNNTINFEVLLVRYLNNDIAEDEALSVLNALSDSDELRYIFSLVVAGQNNMQRSRVALEESCI